MNGLMYTLTLEEPVLANSLAGDANSAQSLAYIPGGLVRGAAITAYGGKKDDAADKDFSRLFLDGRTRFLHAYPQFDNHRTLPIPASWKTYKHSTGQGPVFDFAVQAQAAPEIKNLSFDFWVPGQAGNVLVLEHAWQLNVHTQRDAVHGRAMGKVLKEDESTGEARGTVFRYEALPAGMQLQGVILTGNKQDADALKTLLEKKVILLGKARTAGYGRARIEVSDLPQTWRETPDPFPASAVTDFTLILLSEALVRDANGTYTLDPAPALSARLGMPVTVINAFCKDEIAGGFNRTWGMPLLQSHAIAAGSVFVLHANQPIPTDKLTGLEETGFGERRAEGFGRVAVAVNLPNTFTWQKVPIVLGNIPNKAAPSQAEGQVASLMLERLLRRKLDEELLAFVSKATADYQKGKIPNSQLSRWRVLLRSTLSQDEKVENKAERLAKFYKKENERNSPSWQKMQRVRLKVTLDGKELSPRLTEWLEGMLAENSPVWAFLGYKQAPSKGVSGLKEFVPGPEWQFEYSLRLADGVLAALTKKNSKKKGGENG